MTPMEPEVITLATLVHLARRARETDSAAELAFIAVNETHALTPYRQATLWLREGGVTALSGVVTPEANVPYVQWLSGICRHLDKSVTATRILAAEDLSPEGAASWGEWLPGHGLWLPLPRSGRFAGGGVLLARDEAWSEAEAALLTEWAGLWSQARAIKAGDTRPSWQLPRLSRLVLAAAVLGLFLLPVPLTVLAPAELVPFQPAVIRSPLDGVVEQVLVNPNQRVAVNQPLVLLDRMALQNRLQVALQALAAVQAEYRQKAQLAFSDPASKSLLAALQSQIAEKESDADYLRTLHQRGEILSPQAGVALVDEPSEWVGRPVVAGERILVVADEGAVEMEAWLSPADLIPLPPSAPVALFLNADPLTPLAGVVRQVAHQAVLRPDNHYAYRVRVSLTGEGPVPRIGLKGTAKITGDTVTLGYWIIRRPLAGLRAWLGW